MRTRRFATWEIIADISGQRSRSAAERSISRWVVAAPMRAAAVRGDPRRP